MPGLVSELINSATKTEVPVDALLRQALVVATRLAIPDAIFWISAELNGYAVQDSVPDYRRLKGRFAVMKQSLRDAVPWTQRLDVEERWLYVNVGDAVADLVSMTAQVNARYAYFFPEDARLRLMEQIRTQYGRVLLPCSLLDKQQLHGVLNTLRNRVLNWSLDLEKQGISSEGRTFSQEEKQNVQHQNIHIANLNNSQVIIGSEGASQNQGADINALTQLIQLLQSAIDSGEVAKEMRDELESELATLRAQVKSPKPKWGVINATLFSVKAVLENAAGGVLATQALPLLTQLLRHVV